TRTVPGPSQNWNHKTRDRSGLRRQSSAYRPADVRFDATDCFLKKVASQDLRQQQNPPSARCKIDQFSRSQRELSGGWRKITPVRRQHGCVSTSCPSTRQRNSF